MPKEYNDATKTLVGAEVTIGEATVAMDKVGSAIAEITREEIKVMAKRKEITFEEAEKIYMTRLNRLSGKRGRIAQWLTVRKVISFGGFNYL